MRIGLNAIGYNPGVIGGVETYFRQLLSHLQYENDGHDFLIICKNTEAKGIELHNERFSLKTFNIGRPSLSWLIRGVLFEIAHVDITTRTMNSMPVDVIHHPFTVIEPLRVKIPSVITFWDMQQEFFPEFFTWRERRFRNYSYLTSAQQAKRIIVSSKFTKQCLIEKYNVNPDKIDVIYTGVGQEYCPVIDPILLKEARNRYHLPDTFIYYPAALWPHKNHRTLLDALGLIRDTYGVQVHLVLSGMSAGRAAQLQGEIAKRNLHDMVSVLGFIPFEDLPLIYNLASLMVFPSLFEGFGIPLVEAMASGCPVVCSNCSSIPEVVGEAALLFDPQSANELALAIFRVLNDNELQSKMRAAGLEQAKLFDWRETALKTMVVYEKACS